ncbi:MAG TPA: lysophospholipid acyltransferase family protein [bacterium]|nr:lysophospholipid acyltransferase family protein [bacterium]HPS31067.1 lysophospholipid acyltransferase family protein [bacterium]
MSELTDKMIKLLDGWEASLPPEVVPDIRNYVFSMEDDLVAEFLEKYENAGADWGYSEGSLLVKKCLIVALNSMLTFDIQNDGCLINALKDLKSGKTDRLVILSNHLSYSDANVIAVAFDKYLEEYGFGDKLSVIAGPKVFTHPLRKFASMHFNSLLIAQSQAVATLEVPLPIRVIARAAAIVAEDIKQKVKIFLVFPEGKRSRDGELLPFLQGVYRLIDTGENVSVLPVSVTGGEKFLPVSSSMLNYSDIKINIGSAENIRDIVDKLSGTSNLKQDVMDYLGRRLASIHPVERRGVYR